MALKIFLSYRRRDTGGICGRLFDRLDSAREVAQVFIDVDAIAAGEDFVVKMLAATRAADIVLVLIGPVWTGGDRENRLLNPDDPVRLEIEAALEQGKRVIPVLVDDVSMPAQEDLPESLQSIITLNAVALRHATFDTDLLALFQAIGIGAERPKVGIARRLVRASLGLVAGGLLFMALALVNRVVTGGSMERTLGSSEAVVVALLVVMLGGAAIGARR